MPDVKNFASKDLTIEKASNGSTPEHTIDIHVRINGKSNRRLQFSIGSEERPLGKHVATWFLRFVRSAKRIWQS